MAQDFASPGEQWTLTDILAARELFWNALTANVRMGLCLFPFGLLVGASLGPRREPRSLARNLIGRMLTLLLGGSSLVYLSLVETGRAPALLAMLLPMVSLFLGIWAGRNVIGGPRSTLWLLPKLAGLLLIAVVASAMVGLLVTSRAPLPIQMPKVSSAEKRRLVEILKTPKGLEDGARKLAVSQRDLNLILAMGLPQFSPNARGRVRLEEGRIVIDLSVPLTDSRRSPRYVNLHTEWNVAFADGALEVEVQSCRIGRLPVPQVLLNDVVQQMVMMVSSDRDLRKLLAALGSFRVTETHVEAVIVSRGLVDNILPSMMARFGQDPNVVRKARIYYDHLAKPWTGVPPEDRFAAIVQSAFSLARERSKTEDPVQENRAAILTLAIMLGHWRVEHLVGPVTDKKQRAQTRRQVGFVRLRGRTDWSRHFLVSSALALLSNELLSDQAGLLKEELDAGEGGSGFSFGDLAADRAGTLFALSATRDEPSARRMQNLLADRFDIGVIFPEASDLPEGIPDARFESEYGGVGGNKYNALIAEIERRLAQCPALKQ